METLLKNRSNFKANTCVKSRLLEGMYLLDLSKLKLPTRPESNDNFLDQLFTTKIQNMFSCIG